MGWAWRWRPVTCSGKVGRTTRGGAPSWVGAMMPSGRPIRSSRLIWPEWSECCSPGLRRTRWRRPTLSTRRTSSPGTRGRFTPPPALRATSPASGEEIFSFWFFGADEAVPVRVPQLAVAALGVQLRARLPFGRLDDRGELRRELGFDLLVLHPAFEVPVELAGAGDLDLEAGAFDRFGPFLQRQAEDMRGVAADLDLVQQVTRGEWRRAVDEDGVAARPQHPEGLGEEAVDVGEMVRGRPPGL